MCEVVYGFDAVIRAFTDIQRNAQTQIRSFDRGPYFTRRIIPRFPPFRGKFLARESRTSRLSSTVRWKISTLVTP